MTRQRNDAHSTEFGLWLRGQRQIDSGIGFVATNLDYVWSNYKTKKWFLIEEKRYSSPMTWSQKNMFKILDEAIKRDGKYKGFHLIVFEKTSPEDGLIYIDHQECTKKDLLEFLEFEKTDEWYKSYFEKFPKK